MRQEFKWPSVCRWGNRLGVMRQRLTLQATGLRLEPKSVLTPGSWATARLHRCPLQLKYGVDLEEELGTWRPDGWMNEQMHTFLKKHPVCTLRKARIAASTSLSFRTSWAHPRCSRRLGNAAPHLSGWQCRPYTVSSVKFPTGVLVVCIFNGAPQA